VKIDLGTHKASLSLDFLSVISGNFFRIFSTSFPGRCKEKIEEIEIKLVSEVFRESCSEKNQARKTIRENIFASKIDGKNADEKLLFLSAMFRHQFCSNLLRYIIIVSF
jgi:hypothetical protein